jgi:hypothetical protein
VGDVQAGLDTDNASGYAGDVLSSWPRRGAPGPRPGALRRACGTSPTNLRVGGIHAGDAFTAMSDLERAESAHRDAVAPAPARAR